MSDAPAADIDVEVEAEAWTRALPDAETLTRQAATAGLGPTTGGVVVLLTDDDSVRALNGRFRGREMATNVLSFPAAPNPPGHLGDIALAFGVCQAEARAQGKSLADHLRHLVIHGVLHLLGYDHIDEAEADAMESLERDRLAALGVANPYATPSTEPLEEPLPGAVRHG